jgi:CBS-domain-containing membrane protein
MILVKDIMSRDIVTFFAEQTLPLAEDIMKIRRFRHLPVIDDAGRLAGLVTHRDLMQAQVSSLSGLTAEQRRARQEDIKVKAIMTRDVCTTSPGSSAAAAGRMLLEHRFGCLPVVDDRGRLVGIVTERDFLTYAVNHLDVVG